MSVPADGQRQGIMVLFSASLLCLLLGSVHAFSVFLEPLEAQFSASRSMVSMTYSLALATLTIAVLFGHRLFSRIPAGRLVIAVCGIAALGALIAARASTLTEIWIGYSLLFGGANGLGYSFGLQSAALANPGREGFVMGIVTAAYAMGAAISPVLFEAAMAVGGFSAAMIGLGAALILIAPICAVCMRSSGVSFERKPEAASTARSDQPLATLWVCYGFGVAAGLMAIGHAAGIASAAGWRGAAWVTPTLIAVFNMGGSFGGGWLADRIRPIRMLIALPLISAAALLGLAWFTGSGATLVGLAIVGTCYGAIIAVFPATIAKMFGTAEGTRIYAKVFTAWGTAGLLAPWMAGLLYDRTGGYTIALSIAGGLSLISMAAAYRLSQSHKA